MASGAFYPVLVCSLRFLKRPTHAPSLDCFTHVRHTFLLSYRQGTSTGNTGLPKITSADAPRPRTRGLLRTFGNCMRAGDVNPSVRLTCASRMAHCEEVHFQCGYIARSLVRRSRLTVSSYPSIHPSFLSHLPTNMVAT